MVSAWSGTDCLVLSNPPAWLPRLSGCTLVSASYTHQASEDVLALDLVEPIRPVVERTMLDLVAERTFCRTGSVERSDGSIQIAPLLVQYLASMMPRGKGGGTSRPGTLAPAGPGSRRNMAASHSLHRPAGAQDRPTQVVWRWPPALTEGTPRGRRERGRRTAEAQGDRGIKPVGCAARSREKALPASPRRPPSAHSGLG